MFVFTLMVAITAIVVKNKPTNKTVVMPIDKKTALFISGSKQKIKEYLKSPNTTVRSYDYYLLIINNRLDILEMILKDYGYPSDLKGNDSPLLDAVEELNPKAVELLIKYGADVNDKDSFGNSALILAAKAAFAIPSYSAKSREISKMLIDAGADVNMIGEWATPLDAAIATKDIESVRYIVDHGGDVNYIDKNGTNYLYSCFTIECFKFFYDYGLDINKLDNKAKNILFKVVRITSNDTRKVELLLELGVDICHKDNAGMTVLDNAKEANLNPHLHKDNPEFYRKKIKEHKNTKVYKYLEKEYNKRCLESLESGSK